MFKIRLKWRKIDTFFTIVLFSMFGVIGLWLIDIGASIGNLSCLEQYFGIKIFAQSLLLTLEGYQVYHIGIIFVLISLMVLSYIAIKKSLEIEGVRDE